MAHGPGRERDRGLRASAPPWLRENLEHSLPFLIGGGLCVALAVWLHFFLAEGAGSRLPLWMLLAAVGGTLSGGGLALTVVEEPPPFPTTAAGDVVSVPRAEWEAWQVSQSALRAAAPAPSPRVAPVPATAAPSPPPAPRPVVSRPPIVDPAAVARVTEDLLRPGTAQARPPEWGVTSTGHSRAVPPPGTAAPPAAPAGRPAPKPSGAPFMSTPPSTPAPVPPVWLEEPLREFESMLADLEKEAPATSAAARLRQHPAPLDRCVGCGTSVNVYSEQACIVCDRPLCDPCLERSVIEGRPATCAACHAKVPP